MNTLRSPRRTRLELACGVGLVLFGAAAAAALTHCAALRGHSVTVAETDAGAPFVVLASRADAGADQ